MLETTAISMYSIIQEMVTVFKHEASTEQDRTVLVALF